MSTLEAATLIGAIIGALTGIVSIASVVYLAGTKLAALEVKVDTIWDFIIRRAMSEAVFKGIGVINSPLKITPAAYKMMTYFEPELRTFYQQHGQGLQDRQFLFEIERRFGERLVKDVCIPNGLLMGACLLIALSVAKGEYAELNSV